MSCQFGNRFLKIIIHFVYRFLIFFLGTGYDRTGFYSQVTDTDAVVCFIGNRLCQNVRCTCNRFFYIFYFFFLRYIAFRFLFDGLICHLKQDQIGQRFQPFLFGDRCSGSSLRTIRAVQIFYHYQSLCFQNRFFQFFRQFSLFFDT